MQPINFSKPRWAGAKCKLYVKDLIQKQKLTLKISFSKYHLELNHVGMRGPNFSYKMI